MAGHGFPPADPERPQGHRRRPKLTVVADGVTRGPELPVGVLPDGADWHPRTLAWWDTWRRSPTAQLMTETDWAEALTTAAVHSQVAHGRLRFAAELRLREGLLGATVADRKRLGILVAEPEVPTEPMPAGVSDIAARRRRLTTDR